MPNPDFWTQAAAWRKQTNPYTPSGIASLPPKWLPKYSYEEPGRQPDSPGGYDPDEHPHFGTPENQMTEGMKQEIVDYYAEKAAAQERLKKWTEEKFGVGLSSFSPWQFLAGKIGPTDKEQRDKWNMRLERPNLAYLSDEWIAQNPTQLLTGNYRAPDVEPITVSEDIYNIMGQNETVPPAVTKQQAIDYGPLLGGRVEEQPTPSVVPATNTSAVSNARHPSLKRNPVLKGKSYVDPWAVLSAINSGSFDAFYNTTGDQPVGTTGALLNYGGPLDDFTAAGIAKDQGLPPLVWRTSFDPNYPGLGYRTKETVLSTPEEKREPQSRFMLDPGVVGYAGAAPGGHPDVFARTADPDQYDAGPYSGWKGGGMVNPRPMMGGIGGRGEVLRRMFRRTI